MHNYRDARNCDCVDGLFARELSHRTANMLQQAIAAVHLVRRGGTAHVGAAMDRLAGSAEVNRLLARPAPVATDLADALDALGAAVVRSHGLEDEVSLLVLGTGLLVDAGRARPMLMAAAELVGNAARHAFPDDEGTITIQLGDDGSTTTLVVEDDGQCGGWGRPGGEGRGIVDALATSMGGRVDRSLTPGGSSRVALMVPSLAAAATTPAGSA